MTRTFTPQQLQTQYERISATLQEALFDVDVAEQIYTICKKYGIQESKIPDAAAEIGNIILGLMRPEELPNQMHGLGVQGAHALSFTSDAYEGVLKPLAEELKRAHGFTLFPAQSEEKKIPQITTPSPQNRPAIPAEETHPQESRTPKPFQQEQRPLEASRPIVIPPRPSPAVPQEKYPETPRFAPKPRETEQHSNPQTFVQQQPKPISPAPPPPLERQTRQVEPTIERKITLPAAYKPEEQREHPPARELFIPMEKSIPTRPKPPAPEPNYTKPEPPTNIVVPRTPQLTNEKKDTPPTPEVRPRTNVFIAHTGQTPRPDNDPYRETVLSEEKELPQKKDIIRNPRPPEPPFEVRKGEPPYVNPKIPPIDLRPDTGVSTPPPQQQNDHEREETE